MCHFFWNIQLLCVSVAVVATGCGGELVATNLDSVLSSPGFPNNYTNNLNCVWTIRATVGHRIALLLTDINIERSSGLSVLFINERNSDELHDETQHTMNLLNDDGMTVVT